MNHFQMHSLAGEHVQQLRLEANRNRLAAAAKGYKAPSNPAGSRSPIRIGLDYLFGRASA